MKAIIIDDEKRARILLKAMLEDHCPEVAVLSECADLLSGVQAIKKVKPDLVFLDIEMPENSGLELLDYFSEDEIDFSVIFVTAYNEYAIQAFKLSAVDYILKPINPESLVQAIQQHQKIIAKNHKQLEVLKSNLYELEKKIIIPSRDDMHYISPHEIIYIQGDGSYSNFFLKNKKRLMMSKNLRYVEQMLEPFDFLQRIHKSFIVNLNEIHSYSRNTNKLILNEQIEISISQEKLHLIGLK